ncbi:hypothetical protein EGW08_010651 [Elysia chlorotica]|uniref:RING-type domain-containing protein n=1 Tax=Elysia chlorotica TaxID=188477 RepID=A0A3S0ZN07_ELYCH|nr:hypothetical protein EGW08_010651 [Elysia chlorotica]
MWMRNYPAFFKDQKSKMIRLALCPLLFGISDNLPMAWVKIFVNPEVLKPERIHQPLTSLEMETYEAAEVIFDRCAVLTLMMVKDLKEILNFIYDIEERSARKGFIDVNYALEKLPQLKVFPSIWNPIRRDYEKKKRRAQILILYFFKTIHHQVVHYGRDGQDKAELVREAVEKRARKQRRTSGESKSALAHTALREGRLTTALQLFEEALTLNPFSSQDYCSRAETYIKMEKFVNALPDCWRAMALDQNCVSKSCYQATRCYYELDNLERAFGMNELAMDLCKDPEERKLIEAQGLSIQKAKAEKKVYKYRGTPESELDTVEDDKTSVVFRKLQCEGSKLYQSKKFSEAADKFHEALEMISSFGLEALETQLEDSLILNYCYGLACVRTGIFSNLQRAIEKFNYVICHSTDFPAAHYGLGLAYKSLNRFPDALVEFQRAMDGRKKSQQLQWPQTVIPLEETDPGSLQHLLKNLMRECRHPPKPDAICRYHSDADNSRAEIYESDPDYKGFIRLLCNCKCCIEFHSNCWKTFRHNMGKHIDKEMLDKECPTPNCWGVIINITRLRPDMDHPIEMTSSKKIEAAPHICKPMVKIKTTNALKLQKKAEKKLLRKERREELRQMKAEEKRIEEEEENLALDSHSEARNYGDEENALRNLNAANQKCMVLMEKEPDALTESKTKQKVTKPKKKKEKTKQVLTFDLQFSADKDKELLGVNSLDCDGDYINQPGLMGSPPRVAGLAHSSMATALGSSGGGLGGPASLLPTPMVATRATRAASLGNGLLPLPLRPQPAVDVFMQNLIECLVTVLQGGPQDIDSSIVRDIVGSAPSETQARVARAGGVSAFLGAQPQFVVAAGRVGLAKGGPGILSSGPSVAMGTSTTMQTMMPNIKDFGTGLLETPTATFSMGSKDAGGVAGHGAWNLGVSSQQQQQQQSLKQQKGLLGSFPQTAQGVRNFLTENLKMHGTLNPSAQEFVPGVRKNSLTNESKAQSTAGMSNGQEVTEDDEGGDDDDGEDDSGEFVTVTHKKNSKSLKAGNSIPMVSWSSQNGIMNNMSSVLGVNNLVSRTALNSSNSVFNNSLPTPSSSLSSSSNGVYPDLKLSNSVAALSSSSLSSTSAASAVGSSSSTTATFAMPAPPAPLSTSIIGVGAGRRRSPSDASSTLSEEVRASSPASSASLLSQGSSNSNPASSSTSQGGVCPPQPLKGSGLNLPKRSKRRDLLKEKLASLSGSSQQQGQGQSQGRSVTGASSASTPHNVSFPFSSSVKRAEVADDIDSIDSGNSGDKGGACERDSGIFLGRHKNVFRANNINDIDDEATSTKSGERKLESLWTDVPGSDAFVGYRDEPDPDVNKMSLLDADPFFPGVYDYGSSLEALSNSSEGGRGGGGGVSKFEAGDLGEKSSPLQAVVGQRRRESRVLRNLGLSSHSPSPPPLASSTTLQDRGEMSPFKKPAPLSNDTTAATTTTTTATGSGVLFDTRATTARDSGSLFDSSGNFRPALDADFYSSSSLDSSVDCLKGLSRGVYDRDPWAKKPSESSTAKTKSKFGLGDALYGNIESSNSKTKSKFGLGDALYGNIESSNSKTNSKFGLGDALYGDSDALSNEDPYYPSSQDFGSGPTTFGYHQQVSAEEFFEGSSLDSLHSSVFSAPGVAHADRNTWSPLNSDPHGHSSWSPLNSDPEGQGSAGYHQSWPSRFGHGKVKDGDHDDEENPISSAMSKKKSAALGLFSSRGGFRLSPSTATSETSSSSSLAAAAAAAAAQKSVSTATASVNTELTGEKLKALQLKFYEVKEERDSLRGKLRQEQDQKEFEKSQRQECQERLSELNSSIEKQQKALEESSRYAKAVEQERDNLTQALKEMTDKASQLDEIKGQLQRETMKVKSYEKQILNLHLQATLNNLKLRRKEACSHVSKIEGLILRIRNSEQIEDPELVAKQGEWEAYVEGCERAIEEIIETCRVHFKSLEEGQSLEELLPLKTPNLPPVPKPPSEQSMIGRPRAQVQPAKDDVSAGAASQTETAEDDESAFLKMVFQESAGPKPEKPSQPGPAEAPPPLRLPPGLPRRPLSQGPIPLNQPGLTSLSTRPLAPSTSSVGSAGLASIKLPSGQHVPRPSLASIAATMVPQSSTHQSQAPGHQRSGQPQQMSVFERLVQTIQETFPDQTRFQIQRIIEDLRRDNGGSLARFSFDTLAGCIVERIVDGDAGNASQSQHLQHRGRHRDLRPGSPTEMTCTICHDSTEPGSGQEVRVLDCGHRFHEECIQSWLRVNQTCPNCRSHSLLEEDFPSLRK